MATRGYPISGLVTVQILYNRKTVSMAHHVIVWTVLCLLHCQYRRQLDAEIGLNSLYKYISSHQTLLTIHSSIAFRGFVLRGFANSQGRPQNKNTSLGPSMYMSIETVAQLEQVFEPHRVMFKELRTKRSSSHHSVSAEKRNFSWIFAFRRSLGT
jgi:amino acid permease